MAELVSGATHSGNATNFFGRIREGEGSFGARVASSVGKLGVVEFFRGKAARIDLPTKNADMSNYRTGTHAERPAGERWARGGMKEWLHNPIPERPDLDKVYKDFENYWTNEAKRIQRLFPTRPSDASPHFYQWQMLQQFLNSAGQVDRTLVRKAFEDPDFYNVTMIYMDQEAAKKAHGLKLAKQMHECRNALEHINQLGQPYRTEGRDTHETMVMAAEAAATLLAVAVAAGVAIPPLTPFVASLVAIAPLGIDAIRRAARNINQDQMRLLTSACKTSLEVIQGDTAECDYMQQSYGIDPRDIVLTGNAFVFTHGGSASNSWEGIQRDLDADIALRMRFMRDVVHVDTQKVHALTEQFIMDGSHGGALNISKKHGITIIRQADELVVNQTEAVYEAEVLARFEQLRERDGVPLDASRSLDLQKLMLKARQQLLTEKANTLFEPLLEAHLKKESKKDEREKGKMAQVIEMRIARLGEAGADRALAQQAATARVTLETSLMQGVTASGSTSGEQGLTQVCDVFSSKTDTSIEGRMAKVNATWRGLVAEARKVPDSTGKLTPLIDAIHDQRTTRAVDALSAKIATELGEVQQGYQKAVNEIEQTNTNHQSEIARINADPKLTADQKNAELTNLNTNYKNTIGPLERQKKDSEDRLKVLGDLQTKVSEARDTIDKIEASFSARTDTEYATYTDTTSRMEREWMVANSAQGLTARLNVYGSTETLTTLKSDIDAIAQYGTGWETNRDKRWNLLHAIAEAKARTGAQPPSLFDAPNADTMHGIMLSDLGGRVFVLSPHEILDELTPKINANNRLNTLSSDEKIVQITQAIGVEKTKFRLRREALKATLELQRREIASAEKEKQTIGQQCEEKQTILKMLKATIGDRANTFGRVAEMLTTGGGIDRYADGQNIQANPSLSEIDKDAYSITEQLYPRGLIEFLRDIFQHHLSSDTKDPSIRPEQQFAALMNAIRRNTRQDIETVIANIIVDTFPGFSDLLDPNIRISKNQQHTLTFPQVMAIIACRMNNSPANIARCASLIDRSQFVVARPVGPFSWLQVVRGVIDSVIAPAVQNNLATP